MLREQVPGINMAQRQVSDHVGRHEGSCCGNKSQGLIWRRDKSLIMLGDIVDMAGHDAGKNPSFT